MPGLIPINTEKKVVTIKGGRRLFDGPVLAEIDISVIRKTWSRGNKVSTGGRMIFRRLFSALADPRAIARGDARAGYGHGK